MQHNGVRLTMGNSLDAYKQRFDHHSALTFWLNGTKLNKIQQLVPKWKTRNSEACFSNWFGNSLVGLALSTIRRRSKSKTNSIRKKRNVYIIVQRWLTFLYMFKS